MKAIRTILACIRHADEKYNLINHGDKIVIGISGGKDSIALFYALSLYAKFSHTNFEIQPVILDLGFEGFDSTGLSNYISSLGYQLIVHDAKEVYPILKAHQQGSHLPCSICSRMKKASINAVAKKLGYNKVAFAHHSDDAIETLFMNEIYGARIATFSPKMHLEKADIDFIRPLIFVNEKTIIKLIKEDNLPIFPSRCPADKHTTREIIKTTLQDLYMRFPSAKDNFLTMLDNYSKLDLWGDKIELKVNESGLSLIIVNSVVTAFKLAKYNHYPTDNEQYYLIRLNDKYYGAIGVSKIDKQFTINCYNINHSHYKQICLLFLINYIADSFNPCIFTVKGTDISNSINKKRYKLIASSSRKTIIESIY